MRSIIWTMLAAAILVVSACGSPEQPPAKSAPPAVTTAAPSPAAPPVPAAPPATVAEPPPLPAPVPASPPTPATPAKPAAAVAETPKAPAVASAPAQPAAPTAKIPDSITLDASQGQVTLSHLAHAKSYPCATCHLDGPPGKINLSKDMAHDLCRDCHKAKGAGPTTCTGCHKK